jgi:hypothetical protein
MITEDFISKVRQLWVAESLERYRNQLLNHSRKPEIDPESILSCWDSLTDEQRDGMWQFIRIVMVDTIAQMFSLLDNSGGFRGFPEDFKLVYGPDEVPIKDLLDYFLAAEEDEPVKVTWKI